MKVGIVGSEEAKFSMAAMARAKVMICTIVSNADEVVSGGCHLGGIDIWAEEIGRELGKKVTVFKPKVRRWGGPGGYEERNLQIAKHSDVVYCITVDKLPDTYTGMRFALCYHCGTKEHVKSGGCYTVKKAKTMGKETHVLVVRQFV